MIEGSNASALLGLQGRPDNEEQSGSGPILRLDPDDARLASPSLRIGGRARLSRDGEICEIVAVAGVLAEFLDARSWCGTGGSGLSPKPTLLLDGTTVWMYETGALTPDGTGHYSNRGTRIDCRVRPVRAHVATHRQWDTMRSWTLRCVSTAIGRRQDVAVEYHAAPERFGVNATIVDDLIVVEQWEHHSAARQTVAEFPLDRSDAPGLLVDHVRNVVPSPLDLAIQFPSWVAPTSTATP